MQEFISNSEQETISIAKEIARKIKKGTVIALYGNLGVGKTAFCRGFVQSLCPNAKDVPSPTFTLLQTYDTPDFEIYHFDMYRLNKPEEAFELGIDDAFYEGVCLIEWPEKLGYLLPKNCIQIHFEILENQSRKIMIKE